MNKTKVLCLGVELVALAGATLCMWWWPISGWLHHEGFYQGRPTSYWQQEMEQWSPFIVENTSMGHEPYYVGWFRESSSADQWTSCSGRSSTGFEISALPPLTLLQGDPKAEAVLNELLSSPNYRVRYLTQKGLEMIRRKTSQ
jgi:hypothetical protein